MVLVFGLLVAALGATAVQAEDLKLDATTPTREPRALVPGPLRETHPSDQGYYPGDPIVPYDPAFIPGLSSDVESPTSTGRMGLSGWTSPNATAGLTGAGGREISGWFSLGFTWTWGGPPHAAAPGAATDQPATVTR